MTTAMGIRLEGVSRRIGITRAAVGVGAALLVLAVVALLAGRSAVGLAAVALVGALVGGLTWVAVEHLVGPLRRLLYATEQLTAGDYTVRAQGEGAVELDELAAGVNELAATLETRRAEVEAALATGAEALGRTQNELARQTEVARVKTELVATVSDELRAPLASMRGFLELALADGGTLTAEQRRYVTASLRSSENLLRLVEDLVLVAQIEAGELELALGEVDVLDLAAEAVESARRAADEEGVVLELTSRGAPVLAGDRARLAQALRNLIWSAIEVTPRGGRVKIAVEPTAGGVALTVGNAGSGAAQAPAPFFRTSRAERARVLTRGLALPIAKGIAEAHGGSLGVSGTTARLELPS
jgi:two-component system OmpR family sensor kinase